MPLLGNALGSGVGSTTTAGNSRGGAAAGSGPGAGSRMLGSCCGAGACVPATLSRVTGDCAMVLTIPGAGALPGLPLSQSVRPVCAQAWFQPSLSAATRCPRAGCVLPAGACTGTKAFSAAAASSRLAPILYSTKPLNLSASSSIGGWLPPGWMVCPAR